MKLGYLVLLSVSLLVCGCYDSAEMTGGDNYFDPANPDYDPGLECDPELDPEFDEDMDPEMSDPWEEARLHRNGRYGGYDPDDRIGRQNANGYYSLTEDEVAVLMRHRFEVLDTDADGAVSFEEFSAGGERMFGVQGEPSQKASGGEHANRPHRPALED